MNHSELLNRQDQWVRSAIIPGLWSHPTGFWYFDKSQLMANYDAIANQWNMYDYSRKQRYEYSAAIFYGQNPVFSQIKHVGVGIPEHREHKLINNAEFLVKDDRTKTMFSGTWNREDLTIVGALSSYDQEDLMEVIIHIPYVELFEIRPMPITNENWGLVDSSGNWTGYQSEGYSVTTIEGQYNLYKGTFIGPDGNRVRFEVTSSDPVRVTPVPPPTPPTVIIAGIAAAACLVALGVQAYLIDCNKQLSEAIKACVASGGLPNVSADISFKTSIESTFKFGCFYECHLDCKPKPVA